MKIKELLEDAAADVEHPEVYAYLKATADKMAAVRKPEILTIGPCVVPKARPEVDLGIHRHLVRAQSHFGRARLMLGGSLKV